MKSTLLLILTCCTLALSGQQAPILVFDLVNSTVDSLPLPSFNTSLTSAKTSFDYGTYNTSVASLAETAPTTNLFPNSQFTLKSLAANQFDLTDYPIRTTVKTFFMLNDTLRNLCTGSMISRRHVLTANHCTAEVNTNTLLNDSLYVSPVFDNGTFSTAFNTSAVTKVYFLRDWSFAGEDIAILELAEPLGESTGWIGMGFNEVDSELKDSIYHRFSYPGETILQIDPKSYNGDTLFYNYGVCDVVMNTWLGALGTNGVPGESGSSFTKVKNGQDYTSYGVLSFSTALNHGRFTKWTFHAFADVIKDDLVLNVPKPNEEDGWLVYPNPTEGALRLQFEHPEQVQEWAVYDLSGRKVLAETNVSSDLKLDLSHLPSGLYVLRITTDESVDSINIRKD